MVTTLRKSIHVVLLVGLSSDPSLAVPRVQASQDVRELQPGTPIERELKGGELHAYRLTLAAGQYLRVVVDQRGIDVVVTLVGPDGQKITEVDSPNGTQGPEPALAVTEASGEYRLEVRSLEKTAAPGRYEIKIEELRDATPQDKTRVVAERAFAEAEQFRAQGKADSLRKAMEKYEDALSLFRSLTDRAKEAMTLHGMALACRALGENQRAIDYNNQALPLFQALGDRRMEGATLSNIGNAYGNLGEKQKALDYYNQSLALSRVVGDRRGEAVILNNIGLIYNDLGERQKALEYYNQSLPLRRATGDRAGEAATLNNIGSVYNSLGEKQKALESYTQALALMRATGNRRNEAIMLNNIGTVYASLAEKQKALEYYNQALPLREAVGDRAGVAASLGNIGSVYNDLGEKQKALDHYERALQIQRTLGNRRGEAITLNNIGTSYDDLGEYQKALEHYNQALPLRRAVGDREGEAVTLSNICSVYISLGEYQRGLEYCNQALPLRRAVGDRAGEASTLSNIGAVYILSGEKQKGLDYYRQSLALWQAVRNRQGEAETLTNMGKAYRDLGDKQKALDAHNQALQLNRTVGARNLEASILHNIGAVYESLADRQKALEHYRQALTLRQSLRDKSGEANTLYTISRVERDRNNLTEAYNSIAAAINIAESLRAKVVAQELRTSFLASKQSYYSFYTDLLMRLHEREPSKGHDAEALQASERARARSLLESLIEARVDIRQGVEPTLLERERALQQLVNGKAERLTQLLNGKHTEEQAAAAKKELEALLTEYQEVQGQIRAKSPKYAALTQPQPLSLEEIQEQALDEDTLLLEYALGDERSFLWSVTPTSIMSFELPKRAEIEAAARRVTELLVKQADDLYPDALTTLSRMLLGPVSAQLGKKRLLIVADGALQYVPFAALPKPVKSEKLKVKSEERTGQRTNNSSLFTLHSPLILDHEIVHLPSASVLAVLRRELAGRKSATKTVAVLADPVFDKDDERVKNLSAKGRRPLQRPTHRAQESPSPRETRGLETAPTLEDDLTRSARDFNLTRFERLPATRREAETIMSYIRKEQGFKALDFQASKPAAMSADLGQHRIVHFATHGLLNSQHPELSGVVLSLVDEKGQPQDGFLRLHEIYNLNLPAELVVLSGCRTGLGKEIKGEGLIGLTRGFMYAGAARVLVSLWDVSDVATAELMKRLYRGMLKDGLRPAAALRAAQLSLLKQRRWSAPYYWAGFVLQGEWR